MKLVVTGCNGSVGRRVAYNALKQGHTVLGLDNKTVEGTESSGHPNYHFVEADLCDFNTALGLLEGHDAVVHLAAFPNPTDFKVQTHNANVVISWNVIRACAELGITRIAQASSVNVIPMVYSKQPQFEYFPIDEDHPCLPDEPYGLSKVISELQADTIIRRYPDIRIASLRLHWSIPTRDKAQNQDPERAKNDLWGWVQEDSASEAFLLAVTRDDLTWRGHERFYIVAPTIAHVQLDSKDLRERYYSGVRVRDGKDVSGQKGFFDCGKAERLLGWVHRDNPEN
ncbi:NAD(P)-binding protein [Dentipellis sp. KUC8613]|nr:NAD(P)-binding protein [Dentipellis sp. KUC8613]